MEKKIVLSEAIRVIRVKDDAEWTAEYKEFGYEAEAEYMWTAYGDGDEWQEDVCTETWLEDESYGFMCGHANDRRCYGFTVDVYTDWENKHWIMAEDYEQIG